MDSHNPPMPAFPNGRSPLSTPDRATIISQAWAGDDCCDDATPDDNE